MSLTLGDSLISEDWVLMGNPQTLAQEILYFAKTDKTRRVWQSSAGYFRWFYDADEIVSVVDGDVFVTDTANHEHRLRAGDAAFFPKGAVATWRLPGPVRQIVSLRKMRPGPLARTFHWARLASLMATPTSDFAAADALRRTLN